MAQERGGGQSRQALTHEARSECAHRWPARGRRGCSAREVTSSLSRGHREEGDGVDGGGRRSPLTWASSAKESKRMPMPSHEAGPSRTEPTWPLPRLYQTACGSPAAQPGVPRDAGTSGSPPASLPHPLCRALVRGHSPRPGLPGAPAQSPASAPPPPRPRRGQGPCSTRRRCGSARMGPAALLPGPAWHLWTRAAQARGPTVPSCRSMLSLAGAGPGGGRR